MPECTRWRVSLGQQGGSRQGEYGQENSQFFSYLLSVEYQIRHPFFVARI